MQNWAGNFTFSTDRVHVPTSAEEVQELVANSSKIKVLGTRHSFSQIADSDSELISTEALQVLEQVNKQESTIRLGPGVTYGRLSAVLEAQGYALPNMASLPHISVSGSCATSTHGSGVLNQSLSTSVCAMELVGADGSLQNITGPDLNAATVHLGALGAVTCLTLNVVPTYDLAQTVFDDLPISELQKSFWTILSAAYSVSLFTDWRSEYVGQVWVKHRPEDPPPADFYGARPAREPRHPIPGMPVENCTPQLGVPGPWHERLPHFRMEFTPSSGEELQSEFFVQTEDAWDAFSAIRSLSDRVAPLVQVSEIRSIAADELWMSPFYHRPSVGFHFTWKKDWQRVKELITLVEQTLEPFRPRPHWAKLFSLEETELAQRYPQLTRFRDHASKSDPDGKFRNTFLDRYVF